MAKADWNITGDGGITIIEETGSKRCMLSGTKQMLWKERNNLTDAEVIANIKFNLGSTNERGGLLLRSNSAISRCYRLFIYGNRTYYIQRIVDGVVTTLGQADSSQAYNIYVKIRFRIDGYQLSVEEYINGEWTLIAMAQDTNQSFTEGYCGIFGASVNSSYSIIFDDIEIGEKE